MKLKTSIVIACFLAFTAVAYFTGCAGTVTQQKMTPEREQAIRDSLMREHKSLLTRYLSFGYEHYRQKNYEKAAEYFSNVVYLDTTGIYSNRTYPLLSDIYLNLQLPDSAEKIIRIGSNLFPEEPYYHETLGYLLTQSGDSESALKEYETLTELAPDSSKYWKKAGEAALAVMDNEKATEYYKKAVELNPDDQESQTILSNLLGEDPLQKRDHLINMLVQFPDDQKARLDLARVYYNQLGEFENAIAELEIVLDKDPGNIVALELMGQSYQEMGKYSNAAETFRKILSTQPRDKKNLCNLAISYLSMGRYTAALQQVNKAFSIDSNYGLAYLTKGMIFEHSAEACVAKREGKKPSFDDKLVYEMANNEYLKARRDLEWSDQAQRHIDYLEVVLPTKADRFMHQGHTVPKDPCYDWIP